MTEKDLEKIRKRFNDADQDQDGQLNRSEFLNLLKSFGVKLGADQLTYVFCKADTDGDGTICFEEFKDTCIGEQLAKIQTPRSRRKSCGVRKVQLSVSREVSSEVHLSKSKAVYSEGETVTIKDHNKNGSISVSEFIHTFPMSDETNEVFEKPPMSEQEVIAYCKYFWSSDENCDGKLSKPEFVKMTDALGMKLNSSAVDRAFTLADTNKDGLLSFSEFVTAYLNRNSTPALSGKQIRDIFCKYDVQGRGYLAKKECLQALKTLGNQSNTKRLEQMMAVMDINEDGRISLHEFLRFLDVNPSRR